MPGFTTEKSLYQANKLRSHYEITLKDTFARSGLVIGQQFSVGGVVPLPTFLELECPPCIRVGSSTVSCDVLKLTTIVLQRRELALIQ
jgi:hypothetical protein